MPGAEIQVEGLREFRAAVRSAGAEMPRQMRIMMNEVANGILVPEIIKEMKAEFVGPVQTGRLEASVRGYSTATSGRVAIGTPVGVPYAGWWEFGGSTHSPRGDTRRAFVKDGRTMYPALWKTMPEIITAMEVVLTALSAMIDKG